MFPHHGTTKQFYTLWSASENAPLVLPNLPNISPGGGLTSLWEHHWPSCCLKDPADKSWGKPHLPPSGHRTAVAALHTQTCFCSWTAICCIYCCSWYFTNCFNKFSKYYWLLQEGEVLHALTPASPFSLPLQPWIHLTREPLWDTYWELLLIIFTILMFYESSLFCTLRGGLIFLLCSIYKLILMVLWWKMLQN